MKAFMDLEDYRKSIYVLFGQFPFRLLIVACVVAYIVGLFVGGNMTDPMGMEGISNAFFRGVLFTVAAFYLGRISAESVVKSSHGLTDRDKDGVFIPCLSHKNAFDLSTGAVIIKPDRLYFEPKRPFGGDLTFDFKDYEGFRFSLSRERESFGLFLLTGEKYMLTAEDASGKRLGSFIIPEPERYLPAIQELISDER